VHEQNGHISTSGLKSDVTIVFLELNTTTATTTTTTTTTTTLCLKKNCTPKAGRHKFYYFPNTKIRNIRFVGNFILNKSCEFYYDDVTMTSFIGNK